MIPLQLEISNFLSYRQTAVLDLNGIHLACISGANGAGKSSILDSMTWALFGQSRSRSDDDLVNRLGAIQGEVAQVRLTFSLEDNVYRVTREKKYRKTGSLEFQMATADGGWKTLTESKIRETQQAIERLLRMNYDTFINASFLLQGKADEFTTKTPNRRKEVLADLLGLSLWERYKELAAQRRRETEGRLLLLDGQMEEIDQELNEAAQRETALKEAQEALAGVAARLADKETLLVQVRKVATAVAQQKQQLQTVAHSLNRAQKRLTDIQSLQEKRLSEKEGFEKIIANAATVQDDYGTWLKVSAEMEKWQVKADQFNQLAQAKRPYELTIARAKSRLEEQQQAQQLQAVKVAKARENQAKLRPVLADLQAEMQALQEELVALTAQEETWHKMRAEVQRLEGEFTLQQREREKLALEAKKISELKVDQEGGANLITTTEAQIAALTAQINGLRQKQQQLDGALATQTALETAQPGLRDEMNRLKSKMDQLRGEGDGRCPLCGQSLTASHRQEVLTDLERDGKGLGDRFRENKQTLAECETTIAALQEEVPQLSHLESKFQTAQNQRAQIKARREEAAQSIATWEAEGALRLLALQDIAVETEVEVRKKELAELATTVQQRKELEEQRQQLAQNIANQSAELQSLEILVRKWEEEGAAQLANVEKRLTAQTYDAAAQAALQKLILELEALAYDPSAHTDVRRQLQTMQGVPEQYQLLQQAKAAIKPLNDGLADLGDQLKEQQGVVAELVKQQELVEAELVRLSGDAPTVEDVEDEVFALRETHLQANQDVAVAQNRLDVLAALQEKRMGFQQLRQDITIKIQQLKLLEKSCGRDGVQALLIEQAIPEIEERANELLERLTGGSMRVSFATLKKLKSRDALAETLDIHISDEAGERPYDNYSGGEQFRVNFAIRLALSQLLARRAGARLQTLVIDEGFGSQDPEGRQRLIEAINTIRDDFERILVITHIDELRDAFPTRIEIEKLPGGSTITIN